MPPSSHAWLRARSYPDLLAAIASSLAAVTPQDVLGWLPIAAIVLLEIFQII